MAMPVKVDAQKGNHRLTQMRQTMTRSVNQVRSYIGPMFILLILRGKDSDGVYIWRTSDTLCGSLQRCRRCQE